jgi:hypothetical protein
MPAFALKECQNSRIMANFLAVFESLRSVGALPDIVEAKGDEMKKGTKAILLSLAVFAAVFAAACPERRTVGDIQANPSKYNNKEVVITGTVKDSYGVNVPGTPIRGGAYKIDDGTGSIWVITEEGVPSKGTEIGIRGIVANGANWNGKNYGLGIYEKDRKFRKR